MKYLILITLVLSFLTSCIQDIGRIGCKEIGDVSFLKSDSAWIPHKVDTINYISTLGRNITYTMFQYEEANFFASTCKNPIAVAVDYHSMEMKLNRISINITRYEEENKSNTNIGYAFSQLTNNLIPIIQQKMGLIDVRTNQSINTEEVDFVKTTKLGTHQLNEKTYNDVFVIEDLDKSYVPEIDIFRFYVNPSGILRIEFYDGEIWDRVD